MKKVINPVKGSIPIKYPQGNIYQLYGENVELYLKAIGSRGHNGIDIATYEGNLIVATKGEIIAVNDNPQGYGKHIRLLTDPDENGDLLELIYGHLKDIFIKIGDKVEDGQHLGTEGNTGFVISGNTLYWGNAPQGKGIHLHFGVRECSIHNIGCKIIDDFRDSAIYVKNFTNGLFGYVDPQKFIEVPEAMALQLEVGLLSIIKNLILKLLKLKK